MADQAEQLRGLARSAKGRPPAAVPKGSALPSSISERRQKHARVIAVSSGKGGVGKTNLSVNLALSLCKLGRSVILFDADLGLANADVLLGLQPRYNLTHFFQGSRSLAEIVCEGPLGLKVIPTGSGISQLADLGEQERERLLSHFDLIEDQADFLVIDTGAGISKNVLSFAMAADEVLVVTTPEPTARLDAYGLIKVLAQERYPGQLKVIVNMAENSAEGEEVCRLMETMAGRFLNIHVQALGVVLRDRAVTQAVRAQKPFALMAPDSAPSKALLEMAASLCQVNLGGTTGGFNEFWKKLSGFMRREKLGR